MSPSPLPSPARGEGDDRVIFNVIPMLQIPVEEEVFWLFEIGIWDL
jgi:hypothetical protein